jgi:hypothetical protein
MKNPAAQLIGGIGVRTGLAESLLMHGDSKTGGQIQGLPLFDWRAIDTRREQLIDLDLIEETTRDHVDDGVFLCSPHGHGWRVLDDHRERHTVWTRRRSVARVLKRRSA